MKRCWVILLMLSAVCNMVSGQVVTTEGSDFWVAFLPNILQGDLSLTMTGDVATTGTVTVSGTNWTQTFSVNPGQMTNVTIPSAYELYTDEWVGQHAVHVTSMDNISLYASNMSNGSHDMTNVLPTNALQNNYILQSADSNSRNNDFCIIATEDSTVVNIGMAVNSTGILAADHTYSVAMQSGDTYLVRSRGDVSGTAIWTDGCRPIAVFVGNVCAAVPISCPAISYLYEQAVPTEYWGRKFGVTASRTRTMDMLKVTAVFDSTVVSYGDSTFLLNARESRSITINSSAAPAFYLEGTKPVGVYLYMTGSCGGTHGGPSATVIHPLEQQVSSITFAALNVAGIDSHYVNIVAKRAYADNIFLDGSLVAPARFSPLAGNSNYVYARLMITQGSHRLSSHGGAFVAHVYGLGVRQGYSHAVGTCIDAINPRLFLNSRSFSVYDSTNNMFCSNEELHFTAEVTDEANTIVTWYFGDGDSAVGLSATHAFLQPGDYAVGVLLTYVDDCWHITKRTDSVFVHILNQAMSYTDTVVCDSICRWSGHQYDSIGIYTIVFPTDDICDSIAKLDIKALFLPPRPSIDFNYNCDEHLCHLSAVGEGDYYRWSCTPYNHEIVGHQYDDRVTVTPNVTRTYRLYMAYVSDSLCGRDTTLVVHEIGKMKASPTATPTVADYDNMTIVLKDNTPDAVGRRWYALDSEIGNTQTVEYPYPTDLDSVLITLDAYNMYDCHDTASLTIRFMTDGIYVPNIITPSRGDNNCFQVVGSSLMDGEIWIFDRRGSQVWYSNDIHARWDATHEGTPLPQGTYVYTLRYRQSSEPEVWLRKMGTVTVIR